MSVKEVYVPDIGDFKDADVIEVLVASGDSIAVDDPLLTLETDKASMEVPSTAAGKVKDVSVKVGDKVSEGALILSLEAGADNADESTDEEPKADTATESVPEKGQENDQTSAQHAAEPETSKPEAAASAAASNASVDGGPVYASPAVRRIARLNDVDLTQVAATGAKGRVTKADIEAFLQGGQKAQQPSAKPAAAQGAGIEPIPVQDYSKFGEVEEFKLPRIKQISATHLHRVWVNVPHVTYHEEIDTTDLEAFRKSLKAEADAAGVKVTPLIFLMQALAKTLKQFPNFNASMGAEPGMLIRKNYYHIGIAVDTPNGLVVPVVRDVDKKTVFELAEELGEISAKARDGKLTAKDMSGGCMTISSLGGIGGRGFTPIINAPELAILGVSRSHMEPVWNGTEFVPRLMLPVDLSFDHRVIDGAEAARFVAYFGAIISDYRRLSL